MASKGYQQITALSAATALTVPAGTKYAIVQAETQNVRWRADGVDPAAGVGMLLVAGAAPVMIDVLNAKFIEATASAKLNVHYFD